VALRHNPEIIAKRLDNATVLVDVPSSRIFELNETGTCIWELLGKGVDVDSISRQLVDRYEIDHAQAQNEVRNLITRLRAEGLLEE